MKKHLLNNNHLIKINNNNYNNNNLINNNNNNQIKSNSNNNKYNKLNNNNNNHNRIAMVVWIRKEEPDLKKTAFKRERIRQRNYVQFIIPRIVKFKKKINQTQWMNMKIFYFTFKLSYAMKHFLIIYSVVMRTARVLRIQIWKYNMLHRPQIIYYSLLKVWSIFTVLA